MHIRPRRGRTALPHISTINMSSLRDGRAGNPYMLYITPSGFSKKHDILAIMISTLRVWACVFHCCINLPVPRARAPATPEGVAFMSNFNPRRLKFLSLHLKNQPPAVVFRFVLIFLCTGVPIAIGITRRNARQLKSPLH